MELTQGPAGACAGLCLAQGPSPGQAPSSMPLSWACWKQGFGGDVAPPRCCTQGSRGDPSVCYMGSAPHSQRWGQGGVPCVPGLSSSQAPPPGGRRSDKSCPCGQVGGGYRQWNLTAGLGSVVPDPCGWVTREMRVGGLGTGARAPRRGWGRVGASPLPLPILAPGVMGAAVGCWEQSRAEGWGRNL